MNSWLGVEAAFSKGKYSSSRGTLQIKESMLQKGCDTHEHLFFVRKGKCVITHGAAEYSLISIRAKLIGWQLGVSKYLANPY